MRLEGISLGTVELIGVGANSQDEGVACTLYSTSARFPVPEIPVIRDAGSRHCVRLCYATVSLQPLVIGNLRSEGNEKLMYNDMNRIHHCG